MWKRCCNVMGLLNDVNDKIAENRAEMLASLSALISVPSVAVGPDGDKPLERMSTERWSTCSGWRNRKALKHTMLTIMEDI